MQGSHGHRWHKGTSGIKVVSYAKVTWMCAQESVTTSTAFGCLLFSLAEAFPWWYLSALAYS
eukprot:419938-Pelagomonas_calceolata.AAC.1